MGCSNQTLKMSPEEKKVNLAQHIIRLNRDGLVTKTDISQRSWLDKIKQKPLDKDIVKNNIETIITQAEELARLKLGVEDYKNLNRKKIPVRLLIHVHGGLNYFSDSDHRAKKTTNRIIKDEKDWYYPVFISWPSSFTGTYAEHLFSVREGRNAQLILGLLSSPFILIADIMKSIGKYPLDLYYQIFVSGKDKIATYIKPNWLSYAWKKAKEEYNNRCCIPSKDNRCTKMCVTDSGLTLNRSSYFSKSSNILGRSALLIATAPFRYTLGTLGQSSIAVSSWKNMKRRTKNVFYPPKLFDDRQRNGMAGGEFFNLLFRRIEENKENYDYQVTVIGHSMGSIVLNNALKQHRKKWEEHNVLRNIVYMGAACSINEAIDAVFPLLRIINANNEQESEQLRFYNLMLNRVAEISEITIKGLAPSGSLLIYIDQHLENPEHPLDRTLGSEINVHSSLTALKKELKSIEKYIEFKTFDRYPGYIPSIHREFNESPFWKKSFWKVDTQTEKPKKSLPHFNAYLPYE